MPIANRAILCAVVATLAVCCVSKAADTKTKVRILQFPQDRSLGTLSVCDANVQRKIKDFHYWIDGLEWEYLAEARGAVAVPAGKRVQLVLNKASGNNLSSLAQLGPDDLYELHIGRNADNRCLPHLAALTGLKVLSFPRAFEPQERLPVFTPQGLKQLGALKSLERMEFPDQLTDAGLATLADALPQLRALYFSSRNQITDRGLAVLPKFTALEELNIGGGRISSAGLAVLADMPSLQYLSLWGKSFRDDALSQVRKALSVRILALSHLSITDDGLAHLAGHPNLENLDLYNTKVTDGGLPHLASLPSLKALNLGKRDYDHKNPSFTDAGMAHLRRIKALEHLYLLSVGVGDAGLADLAELSKLKQLDFQMPFSSDPKKHPVPTLFTEKGVRDLARNRSLESLGIGGPAVTDAVLSEIAQMPRLRSLQLFGCPITDKGFAKLAALQSLETLTVRSPGQLTISGLNRLNALSRLSSLCVDLSTADGPALNLTNLTRLESLMLSAKKGSTFRDKDLIGLANLKRLKNLQLGTDLAVTDAGMSHLAGLTALKTLNIGGAEVTDRGLASLTNMAGLRELYISGHFTDAGLQPLENLKALNRVTIYSAANLSAAAKDRLRKNLPNLNHLSAQPDRAIRRSDKSASAHPKPGALAPNFTVTTLDGAKFTLSEQRGKVVLLHFWGTWCGPCVKGLPAHKRVHERLKQKYGDRVVLLDLAMDDTESKLRNFVAAHKLTTPQARIGLESKLAASYGVTGAPDDFMIGPDGRILLNRESPEGPGDTEAVIDRALGLNSTGQAAR